MVLGTLVFVLLGSILPSIQSFRKVLATSEERPVTIIPDNIPNEPMSANFTTEDYLNTTNPYSDLTSRQDALNEVTVPEGSHPLYVLVFVDEEERQAFHCGPDQYEFWEWENWTKIQLERGDEGLVADFGIDIRILGFVQWDSNNSLTSMYDLWDQLERDTRQYLRQWYNGIYWSNYVDAIIGVTHQATPNDPRPISGMAPSFPELDQGKVCVLLKWAPYWADDNLVQHEVSHLFYADDHYDPPCCRMSSTLHYCFYVFEEGAYWLVLSSEPCCSITNSYCNFCLQTIQQNVGRYPIQVLNISVAHGTTDPASGERAYSRGTFLNVTASRTESGYYFVYWLLDGAKSYSNPISVTMDADHNLTARFARASMKTKTNGCFYVPSITTDMFRIEKVFNDTNIAGDQTAAYNETYRPPQDLTAYPDGKVDAPDVSLVASKYGKREGQAGWDYMADVVPDTKIDAKDTALVASHNGLHGNYIEPIDYGRLSVTFDNGEARAPDCLGFVEIPPNTTKFNVTRDGTGIGAMVIFW